MRDRTNSYRYKTVGDLMASGFLEYLAQGGKDEKDMYELAEVDLNFVRSRKDCADFRVAYFVRCLYMFEHEMPEALYKEIRDEVLSFPYEDCGGHGMCTWTENHRLYAGGNEYLLAQKFPEGPFGDGKDSTYHLNHAKAFLEGWMEKSEKYGLCEWCSNNYYSETIAGLSNIIQFVGDKKIVEGAKRVLTLMLFDMFSQTAFNGGYMYNPACARSYADNKVSSLYGNYEEVITRAMAGEDIKKYKDKEGCFIMLLQARDEQGRPIYEVPSGFIDLLKTEVKEVAMKQGVDISDYEKEGLKKYSQENVRYAFEAGAFSDHRVIGNTLRYMCETGLIENDMLKRLMPYAKPALYRTGLIKLIKRFMPVSFDGAAMEEGRVYTYTNKNYSISAAFDYRVGEFSYQQNSLAVNLSHEISLFANCPYENMDYAAGSPGYWIGSATTPRAVACKNIAAEIFDIENMLYAEARTHLFFPTGLFDELDIGRLSDGILLGQTRGVNVVVRTNPGVKFVPAQVSLAEDKAMYQDEKLPAGYYDKEYDLINETEGYHYYLFEVDNTMNFEDFKAKVLDKELSFNAETSELDYGNGEISFSFTGEFKVKGQEFKPEFKRPKELMNSWKW